MELQGKFKFEELAQTAPNAIVSKQIIKNEKGNITLFAFDQNEGLSEHTAPFDALVMIIEGEAMVSIGGENHQLAAGESIIMPANVPHALKAEKAFKMILVMIKA